MSVLFFFFGTIQYGIYYSTITPFSSILASSWTDGESYRLNNKARTNDEINTDETIQMSFTWLDKRNDEWQAMTS